MDMPLPQLNILDPTAVQPRPLDDGVDAKGLVTLIRPARVSSAGTWNIPLTPPLGLAYLAGMLAHHGVEVRAIDAMAEAVDQFIKEDGFLYQGLTIPQIVERIDPASTVIAISCMFTQDWPYTRRLVQAIRDRFPTALLVAGGEHMSALTDFSLRDCPQLDLCVVGEGEETILDLVRAAGDWQRLAQVPGVVFVDRSQPDAPLVRAPARARIRAVDDIPWPAWDLFPVEVYLSTNNAFGVHRGRSMAILATRGCPYKCTFCSNPQMYGKLWAPREPEAVLAEMEYYIDRYGAENFDFYDLTMVLRKEWILEFCRLIEERGLQFTWQLPSGTRSEVIDDEVAAALYRTGCRNITYAPESGSAETLKRIKKQVHLDRLVASIRSALRQGIHVKCNILIGFPWEPRRSVLESAWLSWKLAVLGIDAVEVMLFTPYPGTELFDELQADGTIPELGDDYFRSMAAFLDPFVPSRYCRTIGGRELIAWRSMIMLSFFALSFALRPWRLVRLVKNVIVQKSETVVENRLAAILRRPKPQAAGVLRADA